MIKPIALLFIPAFTIFFFLYNKKYHKKYRLKKIFYAALIILLMVLPVLTYNFLLYKDKGLVDMQFARATKIGFDHKTSKKDFYIIIISVLLLISTFSNIILSLQISIPSLQDLIPEHEALTIGTERGLHDLDPTDSWDRWSNNVIE